MMAVLKSGEVEIEKAVPFAANATDRWNAAAAAVLVVALATFALVGLALQALRS